MFEYIHPIKFLLLYQGIIISLIFLYLSCWNNKDESTVCIEGIEDIDLKTANETTAIQCKYYAKTEYNHSVKAKPIRLMLKHYSENLTKGMFYNIYGFYHSGQEKLPNEIDIDFAKENFFYLYRKKGKGSYTLLYTRMGNPQIQTKLFHR